MKQAKDPLILGIDPAPSKGSTVFDGKEFENKDPNTLARYIHGAKGNADRVLICWDAPLIDLNFDDPSSGKEDVSQIPYYRKLDERLKKDLYKGNSKDHGASVMPFAGCPHWTVSRFALGLPRLGPFDSSELPYQLVQKDADKMKDPFQVVEVHPAVAMYYWLDGDLPSYKGNKKAPEVWEELRKRMEGTERKPVDKRLEKGERFTDDELDSFVAWCLGKRWLEGDGSVELFDDGEGGGMLLPKEGVERLRKN